MVQAYSNAQTDDLKDELLLFFRDMKDSSLEEQAIHEISDSTNKGNSLLLDAVAYLTEINSTKAAPTFAKLMKDKNKVLGLSAIRALGKLGAKDQIPTLITLFQDPETDSNAKPDIIWALGELKAQTSLPILQSEYDDDSDQPLMRKTILEAFGKIKDPSTWDTVSKALHDSNTIVRTAAISILGDFPGHADRHASLISALRDSDASVRIAAAKAAEDLLDPGLKDLLVYRLNNDPDPKVRLATLTALAKYPDGPTTVLSVVKDTKQAPEVWKGAVKLMTKNNYPGSMDAVKALMDADDKDTFSGLSAALTNALIPFRDDFRQAFGLALASKKAPTRIAGIHAARLGHFTEYQAMLAKMAAKDTDPNVQAEAAALIKDWEKGPETPTQAPKS